MKLAAIVRSGALALVAAGAVGLALVAARQDVPELLKAMQSAGAWGPALLAGAYAVACVLFIPGSILTLAAGFSFGLVRGTLAVSAGSVLGATAAFLVGRTLLRGWVERHVAADPRFQAIDRAVGAEDFKIVLLLRLSPVIPFNLLNYALGLTRVRLGAYVLASWLGMLPGTILYVYLGSTLRSLADVAAGTVEGSAVQTLFFGVGLGLTVAAAWVVARAARRALDEIVHTHAPRPGAAFGPRTLDVANECGRVP